MHAQNDQGKEGRDTQALLNLADHYQRRGNNERAEEYRQRAQLLGGAAIANHAEQRPQALAAAEEARIAEMVSLWGQGRFEDLCGRIVDGMASPVAAEAVSGALIRLGRLEQAEACLEAFPRLASRPQKRRTIQLLRSMPLLAEEPLVHLIILCHNREKHLDLALRQLAATDYRNYAVYLADNGSSDRTWEVMQQAVGHFPAHVQTFMERLPTNIGRPAGHNWLLTRHDHSQAAYIAIGDDDLIQVPPHWLRQMIATAKATGAAVVGGKAVNPASPGEPAVIHGGVRRFETFEPTRLRVSNEEELVDYGQFEYIDAVDHVIGCLHIYDRAQMDAIGLFDIRFSPCQLVDIEHHLRTRLSGRRIMYNGLVEFRHLRAMGREAGSQRPTIGNSVGNVIKLLHKYEPADVQAAIGRWQEEYRRWLNG